MSGLNMHWRHAILAAGYFVAWLVLDYVGFLFEVAPGVSPWYPPHGLSLALLMVFGPRFAPLLALGPAINGTLFWLPGQPVAVALIALSVVVGYGAAGAVLRRLVDPALRTIRDLLLFLLVGLVSSLFVSGAAVGGLVRAGVVPPEAFWNTAVAFWAGDTLGVFGLAPVFAMGFMAIRRRWFESVGDAPAASHEVGSLQVFAQIAVFAAVIVLATRDWGVLPHAPLYLLFVPVLWIAMSHGIRGAAAAVAFANVGPLLAMALNDRTSVDLATLQLELLFVSVAGLAVGAAATEARARAEEAARVAAEAEGARRSAEMYARLQERMKELRCLYDVLALTRDEARPLPAILSEIPDLLQRAWQYPEITCARVAWEDGVARTGNYTESPWRMTTPIVRGGRRVGEIEVGYLEERPEESEGPFLAEERILLDGVAKHVSRMIEHRAAADQLAHAQRLGAVGQLTGGVAHDFNNLLTVILGNLDLAKRHFKDAGNSATLKYIDSSMRAADRAAELTRRLLAFSRRQPLSPEQADANLLLDSMTSMLERTLTETIRLEWRPAEGLPPVAVDVSQLESAILNLAINARDAMPSGGDLVLATELAEIDEPASDGFGEALEPGRYVAIVLSDTGVGMTPEVAARAFEPFYTTKGVGKGSGLGLSMVYGFMRQSGGSVTVTSQPGRGTTFRLYLPVAGEPAG